MSDERDESITGFDERVGPPATRAVQPTGRDLTVQDFGDLAGAGGEDLTLDEQSPPFLKIAQGLSPELDPSSAEHIPGLQLGGIFDSVGQTYYPGNVGVDLIVCHRQRHFGKWVPRDLGGGFRGMAQATDPFVLAELARVGGDRFRLPRWNREAKKWTAPPSIDPVTGEEVELVETGQMFVIYAPHGTLTAYTGERAIISCTRTALGAYTGMIDRWQRWKFTQPNGQKKPAPIWRWRWHVTTLDEEKRGNKYKVWNFRRVPNEGSYESAIIPIEDPLFELGYEFFQLIQSGKVRADYESEASNVARDDEAPPF